MKARKIELLSDNRLHGLDGVSLYLFGRTNINEINVGLSILYIAVIRSTILDISFKK